MFLFVNQTGRLFSCKPTKAVALNLPLSDDAEADREIMMGWGSIQLHRPVDYLALVRKGTKSDAVRSRAGLRAS